MKYMSIIDPIRWAALAIFASVILFEYRCDGSSAGGPQGASTSQGDSESGALTVMSANIYLGGKNDRPGLERIACYLTNADIVFLQEADKEAAEMLARKSGLTNLRLATAPGDEYGIAILSRSRLGPPEVYELSRTEPNYDIILRTDVRIDGRPTTLVNTLYAAGDSEAQKEARLEASETTLKLMDRVDNPVVFGGDLNAESGRPEIEQLTTKMTSSWNAAPEGRKHCEEPFGHIDYIFFQGPFAVREYNAPCWPLHKAELDEYEREGYSLSGAELSDHPFVTVELAIEDNH